MSLGMKLILRASLQPGFASASPLKDVSEHVNKFLRSGLIPSSQGRLGSYCQKWVGNTVSRRPINRGFKRSFQKNEPSLEAKVAEPVPDSDMSAYQKFVKPVLFTVAIGVGSVAVCTIWQYEAYRSNLQGRSSITRMLGLPSVGADKRGEFRQKINDWWNGLSPGEQVFWPICALNGLVFAAWKVPALTPFLAKWFSTNPYSRAVALPMLLSVFSHYSLFHLGANMFVLHSFTPTATHILGREQFLAMYLTAGVVSSLGSHFHKLYIGSMVPSLGASGAIMGILGLVCSNMPDIPLGIIFIPNFTFSADTALKGILALDTVGVLAGWRFFDHAAHLSGCLFGVAFNFYAAGPLNALRELVTKKWHAYRSRSL